MILSREAAELLIDAHRHHLAVSVCGPDLSDESVIQIADDPVDLGDLIADEDAEGLTHLSGGPCCSFGDPPDRFRELLAIGWGPQEGGHDVLVMVVCDEWAIYDAQIEFIEIEVAGAPQRVSESMRDMKNATSEEVFEYVRQLAADAKLGPGEEVRWQSSDRGRWWQNISVLGSPAECPLCLGDVDAACCGFRVYIWTPKDPTAPWELRECGGVRTIEDHPEWRSHRSADQKN